MIKKGLCDELVDRDTRICNYVLVLSMIVATLVETVHRVFYLRARGLRNMLGQFYSGKLEHFVVQAL